MNQTSGMQEANAFNDVSSNLQSLQPGEVVLDTRMEVPVHPLHDEEDSRCGSTTIGVVYSHTMQGDYSIMYGQCPRRQQRTQETFFGFQTNTLPHLWTVKWGDIKNVVQ